MVAAMVTLGVVYAGGGRQAIDRAGFRTAVFAGVDRLLGPLVEFVFPSDGAVGVARTQSCPRQLTDALKRACLFLSSPSPTDTPTRHASPAKGCANMAADGNKHPQTSRSP